MPKISYFEGISIYMHYDDHSPPHFHARYAGTCGTFLIDPPRMTKGRLLPNVRANVVKWTKIHRGELMENWRRMQRSKPLFAIEPMK